MPTSIHADFFAHNYRDIPGGIYCISSAESRVYRPQKGYKKAFKVGSSWNLGKRTIITCYLTLGATPLGWKSNAFS